MTPRNHLSHKLDLLSQNPDLNSRGHRVKRSRTGTISNSFSSKLFGSEGLCVMDEERDPPAYHSHILLFPFACLVYSSGGIVTGLNCSSDCNNRLLYHCKVPRSSFDALCSFACLCTLLGDVWTDAIHGDFASSTETPKSDHSLKFRL